jgi:transposase
MYNKDIMKIKFKEEIKESLEDIKRLEKTERHARIAKRLQFLRLLKSGEEDSLSGIAKTLGIGEKTARNWWKAYKKGGIENLKKWEYKGRKPKITQEDLFKVIDWENNPPATLREARDIIKEKKGIDYTLHGLWYLFRNNKIKLKTGRPRNYKKDLEKEEEFKKTFQRE